VPFEGLIVFGPGSEWLWSMLQFVVVAVSLLGLYRQLRESGSHGAIRLLETFSAEWESPLMVRHRLDFLVSVQRSDDPAEVSQSAATAIMNWWEKVATLARRRDLDRNLLAATWGGNCQYWWTLFAPVVYNEREVLGDKEVIADWEWLAGYCARRDARSGGGVVFDAPFVAGIRDSQIARLREQIEIERSLRTLVVMPAEA
jgi:hypothetical protein